MILINKDSGERVQISSPEISENAEVIWGVVVEDKDFSPGERVGYRRSIWRLAGWEDINDPIYERVEV
jgi:hypothetical protein